MKRLTPARVTFLLFVSVAVLISVHFAKWLQAAGETSSIVAMRSIPMGVSELTPGTVITEAHIGNGRFEVSYLKPGMFLKPVSMLGRVVKTTIPAGTPIHSSQLYPPGERPALKVSEGMRGHTVLVDESTVVGGGHVKPGDSVDVHMTATGASVANSAYRGGLSLTLFEGIKVLAINSNRENTIDDRFSHTITLELTPKQVNIITLAGKVGQISMAFNPDGKGTGLVELGSRDSITIKDLLLGRAGPLNHLHHHQWQQKEKPSFVSENFRGSQRETLRFRNGRRADEKPEPDNSEAPHVGVSGNGLSSKYFEYAPKQLRLPFSESLRRLPYRRF